MLGVTCATAFSFVGGASASHFVVPHGREDPLLADLFESDPR